MKTLIVYDGNADIKMTMMAEDTTYNCIVQDISDNKEIVGVDLELKKVVVIDIDSSSSKKAKAKEDLDNKNKIYLLENKLSTIENSNEELNLKIKTEIEQLKKSDLELVDYIGAISET